MGAEAQARAQRWGLRPRRPGPRSIGSGLWAISLRPQVQDRKPRPWTGTGIRRAADTFLPLEIMDDFLVIIPALLGMLLLPEYNCNAMMQDVHNCNQKAVGRW